MLKPGVGLENQPIATSNLKFLFRQNEKKNQGRDLMDRRRRKSSKTETQKFKN